MAPEVIKRKQHDYSVDYYALGVIIYELIMQKRPYSGRTRKKINEQMNENVAELQYELIENKHLFSKDIVDFCNLLMQFD